MAKSKIKKTDDPQEKSTVKSVPQVNDIAKPGQTAALPTSRPIITSHTGIIKQDPMVASDGSAESDQTSKPDEKSEAVSKKSEIVINPISSEQDTITLKNEPEKEEKSTRTPEDDIEKSESETPAEESAQESSSSDSAEINSLADSAEAKKQAGKDTETKEQEAEKIKELIASKKYFVPIVEGGHKATSQRFMTWLLILLVMASVGVYFAIDAGYLDVGLELPYDLIKE